MVYDNVIMALLKYFNSITVLYDDIFDIFSNRRKYQFDRGVPREVKIVSGVFGSNRSVGRPRSVRASLMELLLKLSWKCLTFLPTRFFTEVWRTLNGFHNLFWDLFILMWCFLVGFHDRLFWISLWFLTVQPLFWTKSVNIQLKEHVLRNPGRS